MQIAMMVIKKLETGKRGLTGKENFRFSVHIRQ